MQLYKTLLDKLDRKIQKINIPNSSRENLYLKHRVFKNNTHHIAVYLETGKKKDKFVTFVSLDEAVLLNNLGVPEVN